MTAKKYRSWGIECEGENSPPNQRPCNELTAATAVVIVGHLTYTLPCGDALSTKTWTQPPWRLHSSITSSLISCSQLGVDSLKNRHHINSLSKEKQRFNIYITSDKRFYLKFSEKQNVKVYPIWIEGRTCILKKSVKSNFNPSFLLTEIKLWVKVLVYHPMRKI